MRPFLVLLLLGSTRAAQPTSKKNPREVTGFKVLALAQADAGELQGGARAMALLRVAQCYAPNHKAKAIELFRAAFNATREMDDDEHHSRAHAQESVLRTMASLDPATVDELLPYADASSRPQVLEEMIGYYQRTKQLNRALSIIYSTSREAEFPYAAGNLLMKRLPESESHTLLQLFTTALGSFRDHPHHGIVVGGEWFDTLIVNVWNRLPPELVEEAINEVLNQAANSDTGLQSLQVTAAGAKGSVSLSYLEFVVFELEPVLRQVDESEADDLLKKYTSVKASLLSYPKGVNSLQSEVENDQGASYMVGPAGGMGDTSPMAQGQPQASKILADCEVRPHDAVANAFSIMDKDLRRDTLVEIAARVWQKSPSDAKEALKDAAGLATEEGTASKHLGATRALSRAAHIYLKMGEEDSAKSVVENGFKLADELQKDDESADDPNTALKAYWPYTDAFIRFTSIAGEISPSWAMQLLKTVKDNETRSLTESFLAATWLNICLGSSTELHIQTKKTNLVLLRKDDQSP